MKTFLTALLAVLYTFVQAQSSVIASEYFIDTDPGFGNATNIPIISGNNILDQNIQIDLTNIGAGTHHFYIRSLDNLGNWSITNQHTFYKTNNTPNIEYAEYFIDTDPGFGQATPISITSNSIINDQSISVDISGLQTGLHYFYLRSRDANGNYSITGSKIFYKLESISNINYVEYFIDSDPGFGQAISIPISVSSEITDQNISVDLSGISLGLHQFYIRSKNINGQWSITNRHMFYTMNQPSHVVKSEYFIDTDPGFGNGTNLPILASQNIIDQNVTIDISNLQSGKHRFFIRSMDENGKWGITNSDTFHVASISSGLIAHYPFTGNANDAIGTNHGTASGATLTTDRFGNANSAYQFDGVNDIINFANLATLQVDNFTVSAWVKPTTLSQFASVLYNGFDNLTNSGNGWGILQNQGQNSSLSPGNFFTGHYPYSSFLSIGKNFSTANIWYHLTLVRDNGVSKFYLNGTSNGLTSSAPPLVPTGSLSIGGSNPGVSFFSGTIDEVKIYNTALTPTQVQQEYTSSAPTLIAHYPFTGNANDAIGTNHGTANGPTLTTDRFGNANSAYQFDGVNDIINFANLATTQVDNFTMTAWVKTASLNQYAQIAINGIDQPGVTANGWGIMQRNISNTVSLPGSYITPEYPNSAWLNLGQTITTANQWMQVALVRNNGVTSFYINGASTNITNNSTPIAPTGSLSIGGSNPGVGFFNGAIDEVKIYNTALTPTQIQQEYTNSASTLIAHYPFTGNANDAIGTNHGTPNGATLTVDRFGNANSAYSFDGTNDVISTLNVATTQTDNFTMSAWVKPSVLPQLGEVVLNGFDNTVNSGNGYALSINNGAGTGNGSIVTGVFGGVGFYNTGSSLSTANNWYHLTITRNNGVSQIYINGIATSSTNSTTPATPVGTLRIGGANGGRFFNGDIDEVKIYNTPLTATEVLAEYNATAPTPAVYSTSFNNSVQLNATTDWIDVPANSNLDLNTSFTLESWVHPTGSGSGCCGNFGGILFSKENSYEVARFSDGSLQYALSANGNGTDWTWINTGINIPLNTWSHISIIKNGTTLTCYFNGNLAYTNSSAPAMMTANTYSLRFGARIFVDQKFQGMLDEMRVWNIARTQTEISSSMNTELIGNESGLVAYYKMNETGQGQNITVANSATTTGSSLNGTTTGTGTTPIFTNGAPQVAKSLHFDGNDDHVTLGNWGAMPNQGTIAFYMNAASSANVPNAFCTHGSGNAGFRLEWYAPGGFGLLSGDDGGGFAAYTMIPAGNVQTNQWYHIAFSWDKTSNTIQGYVDGVQVFNSTCTLWATNWPNVQIGHGYGSNRVWNGYLDEFVFYNNVLSPSDVNNLKTCSPTLPASNVLAYYNFNQGMDLATNSTVSTLIDATGNHNGTLNNFALSGATSNWSASTGGAITCTGITLSAGSIGSSQTICGNNPPNLFSNITSASITNNATITYQWQDSIVGGIWTNIAGENAATYQATNTAGIKYFRRKASALSFEAYSNVINLDITNTVGDPALFPSNSWNVYCYNGYDVDLGSGVEYRGMYTVNTLNLNSTNEFGTISSPSSYSGYQGCNVPTDFFTWVYKRQGFPDGDYVMSSTGCDDVSKIYVNGNLMYTTSGFGAFNNISLGHLDANSIIEIRCAEYSGPGYANFTFTTATFNGGTISGTQSNCGAYTPSLLENTQSAFGGSSLIVSYQWQQSADGTNWFDLSSLNPVHQPGLISSTTYFRRRATNGNNEQAYSNIVIASVTSTTWYADIDGDGFGDPTNTLSSCTQPSGFIADNTDCNDNDPLQKPGQVWTLDNDEDDYGAGVTVTQCTRPLHGYIASELTATHGDCNDNDATINPSRQYFNYSTNNFSSEIAQPLNGSSYTTFNFEIVYTDLNNNMPPATYPRIVLDYEANGIYTNANDRAVIMLPKDENDLSTSDGKTYIASINSLPVGLNYQTLVMSSVGACNTIFGPFNYPDVQIQPDIQIFANDITFSQTNPNPSSPFTVSAVIHNVSDFSANNFTAHLVNQFDNNTYTDINIATIAPHSSTTVTWNITTPSVDAFCPMQVFIDYANNIDESNELDNNAVRPFLNGNVFLTGSIVATTDASPKVSCNTPYSSITIYGHAHYAGVAIPQLDTNVAGATITLIVQETGAQYYGYTNTYGDYAISIPRPLVPGLYHVNSSCTDYTLTGNGVTEFTIISCAPPCLPNLTVGLNNVPGTIIAGATVNADIIITNNGCAATPATIGSFSQTGGIPDLSNTFTIPSLTVGQSITLPYNGIQFNSPGVFNLCAYLDINNEIIEMNEGDNGVCRQIVVLPNLPDIQFTNATNGSAFHCNASGIGVSLYNAGGAASGSFILSVDVIHNNATINTLQTTVTNIPSLSPYYVTFPYTYTPTGEYTFNIHADVNNVVVETNELNNQGSTTLFLNNCKPNLKFVDCYYEHSKPLEAISTGNTYNGSVELKAYFVNDGNLATSTPIEVKFELSGGSIYTTLYTNSIPAGGSANVSVTIPSLSPANQTCTVTLDDVNSINEFSEADNVWGESLCWEFYPAEFCNDLSNFWEHTYAKNQAVTPYVSMWAPGLFNANAVEVNFKVSGPGLAGIVDLGNTIITNTSKICHCGYMASLPNTFVFPDAGTYTFTFTVDPNHLILECDETNNVLIRTLSVTDLSDLRTLSQFINPSLLNPSIGEPIQITGTYENIGASNINDQMKFKLFMDNVEIESINSAGGLAQGDNASYLFNTSWSSLVPGLHIAKIVIDADNQIAESNELNNSATRAIIVGESANLYFASFSTNNYYPQINSTINIIGKIKNSGALPIQSTVQYSYINNSNQEIVFHTQNISLNGYDSVSFNFPWTVIDQNTVITAKIINSNVLEYDFNDNEASFKLGEMKAIVYATPAYYPACEGDLHVYILGGQAPFTYIWNNNEVGQDITLPAGTYTVTVTDATGQSATASATIGACQTRVRVGALIQGYYDIESDMEPVLLNQGINTSNYFVDTVTIEFHEATAPYNLVSDYKTIMRRLNYIDAFSTSLTLGNSYYIVIKHRNTIETWSASPVTITSNTIYDFTISASQAFGDNQIEMETGIYAMYSGDLNQDENIDLLDISLLEVDISNFEFGYFASDINGDGNVDLLDIPILENNINSFIYAVHP